MPNATAAEWLIARFTDCSRASAIVGDLLEVTPQQETPLFWLRVAAIVLSFTWRSIVAFSVALFSLYVLHALTMPVRGSVQRVFALQRQVIALVNPFFALVGLVVVSLWIAAPYAVIRFGLRDRFSQVTLALCIPFTLISFFWFVPAILFTSLGIVAVILLGFMLLAQGRKAILSVAIATALGYVGLRATIYLSERYLEWAAPSVTRTVMVRGSLPFWVALIFTAACSWAHHLLLQRDQDHPKAETA